MLYGLQGQPQLNPGQGTEAVQGVSKGEVGAKNQSVLELAGRAASRLLVGEGSWALKSKEETCALRMHYGRRHKHSHATGTCKSSAAAAAAAGQPSTVPQVQAVAPRRTDARQLFLNLPFLTLRILGLDLSVVVWMCWTAAHPSPSSLGGIGGL